MTKTIVKLAAFMLVCITFTGYLALTIGNLHPFEKTYTLHATFDDVTGLLPNDNVKVAGVVVGKVTGVGIDKGHADVKLAVKRSVKIPTDSTASIRWRNLLGQRYVYLYPGSAPTVLRKGERVPHTKSVVDLGELFNRLGPIVAAIDPKEVNTFLDAITQALDGNTQEVSQVIDDLAKLTAALGTRDKAIGHLITDLDTVSGTLATRDKEIRTVLDNLVALATTFSANVDVVNSAITDVGSVSRDAGTLLRNNRGAIDDSLAHLVTVLDEVKGRLGTIDAALGDLPKATQAIYRSGRYGEWLNQIILCASNGPPPAGKPCATPISKGDGSGGAADTPPPPSSQSSSSTKATTSATGVDAVRQLLGIG